MQPPRHDDSPYGARGAADLILGAAAVVAVVVIALGYVLGWV